MLVTQALMNQGLIIQGLCGHPTLEKYENLRFFINYLEPTHLGFNKLTSKNKKASPTWRGFLKINGLTSFICGQKMPIITAPHPARPSWPTQQLESFHT